MVPASTCMVPSQTQCQCQSIYTLDIHYMYSVHCMHCSGPSVAPVQLNTSYTLAGATYLGP